MAAEGEELTLDLLFAPVLEETDAVLVNVGGIKTEQARIAVLRAILNAADQVFSGLVTALKFAGDGALLTNIVTTGVGGTSSAGSLSLVCNSGGANPGSQIVWFKDGLTLGSFDENGFSPATGIPYSHADSAIPFAKDINANGFDLINSKTISELQRGKGIRLNGTSHNVAVTDNANINFAADPFSIAGAFRINGDHESGSIGRIIHKRIAAGPGFVIFTRSDGDNTLQFEVDDGITDFTIKSDNNLVVGKIYLFVIRNDRSGNANMHLSGELQADTSSSSAGDTTNADPLYIGQNDSAGQHFNGELFSVRFFNRYLTDDESKSSNLLKQLDFKDIGANQTELTGGTLTPGKGYKTKTFVAGDNFTNVADIGAAANVTGAEWVAIATTPTTWTNSSVLKLNGCIYEPDFENCSPERLPDKQNRNDGAVDADLINQGTFEEYNDRYYAFATDNNTFDLPDGSIELQIFIDVITGQAAQTIRIGTSDGGEEVVADVSVASSGMIKAAMVLDTFRDGDQLFIGSDGGSGWTTLDFDLYVKYNVIGGIV